MARSGRYALVAGLLVLAGPMPVFADKSLKAAPGWKAEPTSRCEWVGGGIDPILSCTSQVETDDVVIIYHCGSSSIESKCQTFRKEKEKPVAPSVTDVPTRDGGTIRVLRGGNAIR